MDDPGFTKLLRHYRKRPHELLRRLIQALVAALFLLSASEFYDFLAAIREPLLASAYRPPMVEGFLPIAGIMALRAWMATGIFDPLHPAGLVLLTAALATAWLFRRALCGWLCPIGAFSELLARLGLWLRGGHLALPKWLDRGLLGLKYALLVPLVYYFFLIPARDAVAFVQLPYYAVSDVKMFEMFAGIGLKGMLGIALLAGLSVIVKSFWCRYLCPYGAVQGVLGLVSPVILRRNPATCVDCGKCTETCPNGVDVARAKGLVVTPECTGCATCVGICPKSGALEFRFLGKANVKPLAFGLAFLAVFFGAVAWAKLTGHWDSSLTLDNYRVFYRLMGR